MADVAEQAGVSVMTVSRVLNGYSGVSQDTRARVEDAITALGYRANAAARVLAGGRSRALGVIATETDHFGPAHMLFGLEAAAREAGQVVSFVTLRNGHDDLRPTLDHLRAAHVEAAVIVAPLQSVVDAVVALDAELPFVVVGGHPSVPVPTVTIGQAEGARLATDHLLDLGHTTVHHIRGAEDWIDAAARQRGWEDALQARGAPKGRCLVGDWSAAGGYAAGAELAADPHVTAIFAANDQTALGVLRALHEAGRSVPGDVSIVGFDDTPESAYYVPPLTTVRQDFGEVGRRCVELLLTPAAGGGAPEHVVVAPELVVRESSAAPR